MNAACHRSLYGYQMRAALALAVEQTHAAVTFLPLACSGSTIDLGFLNPLRARECPPTGNCPGDDGPASRATEGRDGDRAPSRARTASSISSC